MIRIIINGSGGHMGRAIQNIVKDYNDIEIVAGIDPKPEGDELFPVFENINKCDIVADVIIDFSISSVTDDLLNYIEMKKIPLVLCTTGLSDTQLERVKNVSKSVAILRSANMSLGINVLAKVLKEVSKSLAESGFDIEIIEKHHNKKIDAPSGTALYLGEVIKESLDKEYKYNYNRTNYKAAREDNEIGISVVRGGTIVGEHEVIYAGTDEVIEFKHIAYSKNIFAKGAIEAAIYLVGKSSGMYNMNDVIEKNV